MDTLSYRESLDNLLCNIKYPFVASCHTKHVTIYQVDNFYQVHANGVLPLKVLMVLKTSVYWHHYQQLQINIPLILSLVQAKNHHYLNHNIK